MELYTGSLLEQGAGVDNGGELLLLGNPTLEVIGICLIKMVFHTIFGNMQNALQKWFQILSIIFGSGWKIAQPIA